MAFDYLTYTRNALRLKTTAFDVELTDLINAAKTTMYYAGVGDDKEPTGVYHAAVATWVKAHFGNVHPDLKKAYMECYNSMVNQMALADVEGGTE